MTFDPDPQSLSRLWASLVGLSKAYGSHQHAYKQGAIAALGSIYGLPAVNQAIRFHDHP